MSTLDCTVPEITWGQPVAPGEDWLDAFTKDLDKTEYVVDTDIPAAAAGTSASGLKQLVGYQRQTGAGLLVANGFGKGGGGACNGQVRCEGCQRVH